jgi:hypothetical protein
MKHIRIVFALIAAMAFAAPATAQQPVAVDLSSLIGTLAYNYDEGKFSGDFNMSISGLTPGDVTFVIENAKGEKVFERVIPCADSYSGNDTPSCYTSSSEGAEAKPYDVQPGKHTVKILSGGKPVYEFIYDITVKTEYEYKNVYVTGDWDKTAVINFASEPGLTVRVPMGDPAACGGSSEDAQVQLLRNGELVGRGHTEGYFYPSCSLVDSSFMIFTTGTDQLTEWISGQKQIFKEGQYELKVFRNRKLDKTYSFKVEEGGVTGAPPAGLQAGLLPGRIISAEQEFMIYQK